MTWLNCYISYKDCAVFTLTNIYILEYDKNVKVTLKNGRQIVGLYNDEFYEDASILVNYEVVKIEDIEKVELIGEEIQ